jgi:hypothetical protein
MVPCVVSCAPGCTGAHRRRGTEGSNPPPSREESSANFLEPTSKPNQRRRSLRGIVSLREGEGCDRGAGRPNADGRVARKVVLGKTGRFVRSFASLRPPLTASRIRAGDGRKHIAAETLNARCFLNAIWR